MKTNHLLKCRKKLIVKLILVLILFIPRTVLSQIESKSTIELCKEDTIDLMFTKLPNIFNKRGTTFGKLNKTSLINKIFTIENDGLISPSKSTFDLNKYVIKVSRQPDTSYNVSLDSDYVWNTQIGEKISGSIELPFWFRYGRREFKSITPIGGILQFVSQKNITDTSTFNLYRNRWLTIMQYHAQIVPISNFIGDVYYQVVDSSSVVFSFIGEAGWAKMSFQVRLNNNGDFLIAYNSFYKQQSNGADVDYIGFSFGESGLAPSQAINYVVDFRSKKIFSNNRNGLFELFSSSPRSDWLLTRFYETHPDSFDIVVLTSYKTKSFTGGLLGTHAPIRRIATGLGFPPSYQDPKIRLFSVVSITPIDQMFTDGIMESADLHTFNHEVGHQWLFSPAIKTDSNFIDLDRSGAHPVSEIDTRVAHRTYQNKLPYEVTCMGGGGYYILDSTGKYVGKGQLGFGYSYLELYLMGLIPPDSVPPLLYVKQGIAYNYSIQHVINAIGIRKPSSVQSQRSFRAAILYVIPKGFSHSPKQALTIDSIGPVWENLFSSVTGGRANLNTEIIEGIQNSKPIISFFPPLAINAGSKLQLKVVTEDVDGDSLFLFLLDSPRWMTVENNSLIIAPEKSVSGTIAFTIRLSDGRGGIDEKKYSIKINKYPLKIQQLNSPSNGSVNINNELWFKWFKYESFSSYKFSLSSDSLFSNTILDSIITDTSLSIKFLTFNKKYWWRVKPKDISDSIYSDPWYFITKSNPTQTTSSSWNNQYIDSIGWINDIKIDNSGNIFLGCSEGGLLKSTDGGISWERMGLKNILINRIEIIGDSTIYVGTAGSGIITSTDKGKTWRQWKDPFRSNYIYCFLIKSPLQVYAGTDYGILYSNDKGQNWSQVLSPGYPCLAMLQLGDTVFFSVQSAILKTTDWFSTWSQSYSNPAAGQLYRILLKDSSNNLYAKTPPIFSNDFGNSWKLVFPIPYIAESGIIASPTFAYFINGTSYDASFPIGLYGIDIESLKKEGSFYYSKNFSNDILISKGTSLNVSPDGRVLYGSLGILYTSKFTSQYPQKIQLFKPNNNEVVRFDSIKISWSSPIKYYKYNFQISKDTSFVNLVYNKEVSVNDSTDIVTPLSKAQKYYWRIKTENLNGEIAYSERRFFTTSLTNINDQKNIIITNYRLSQNYPNPFNPSTTILYDIPKNEFVKLKVYDMLGREVATLLSEEKFTGSYALEWNARNIASGLYIARLTAGSFSKAIKMTLIK